MFSEHDWMTNAQAVDKVIRQLHGNNLRFNGDGVNSAHPVRHYAYPLDYDISPFNQCLIERLDALDWQIVNSDGCNAPRKLDRRMAAVK
jgi:hypothetical protein